MDGQGDDAMTDAMTDATTDAMIGVVLQDSYRIIRVIGAGAMGTVYEGLQLRLGKRVAVKVLSRDLASKQQAMARFHREARITSQLGHPHIVNVFDFGAAPSGEPYMVMEYLEGEDLEHRLRRVGRLDLPTALHIIRQIASALAATHDNGVVHRDLKPANVFLLKAAGEEDFVKVVDFGISKARDAATLLTREHAIIGTPQYMSPEQAIGRKDEMGHLTDQWALACIVYEMLEGRPAFTGEAVSSILFQVVHQEIPPLEAATNLPPEVERVLRKALSKPREERFPSVRAFSSALHIAAGPDFGDGDPTPTPVRTFRYRSAVQNTTPSPVPVHPSDKTLQATGLQFPATTLSHTTGEMIPAERAIKGWRKVTWAVATVVGALLLVGGLLFFRMGSLPSKPGQHTSTAAPRAEKTSEQVLPSPPPARAAIPVVHGLRPAETAAQVTLMNPAGPIEKNRTRGRRQAKTTGAAKSQVARPDSNALVAPAAKPKTRSSDDVGF